MNTVETTAEPVTRSAAEHRAAGSRAIEFGRPVDPPRARRRFTGTEVHRMVEAGILHEDDNIELIEGDLLVMAGQGPRHGGSITCFDELLHQLLGGRVLIRPQLPLALSEISEPEPDFAVVKRRDDYYRVSHPTADDVFFLVEMMDSSGRTDRRAKLPLYARHNVPEVWLVDLPRRWVEIYREPTDDEYTERRTASGTDEFSPAAFPDVAFTADAIIRPADDEPQAESTSEDQ